MKHIKLFENWNDPVNHPREITIRPTQKWKERLKEMKNSEGKPAFATSSTFTLWNNLDTKEFDMAKIATVPFDIRTNTQDDYWAAYHPENKEIYVDVSRAPINASEFYRENNIYGNSYWRNSGGVTTPVKWIGGFYCKFDTFIPGAIDHRGYFEIVETK
jgi:hypothetical protein